MKIHSIKVSGNRLHIHFQGCTRGCKGCFNKDLWDKSSGKEMTLDEVKNIILIRSIGVTISGGEPLEQAEDTEEIIRYCNSIGLSTILYTGYNVDEINSYIKNNTSAIIAGEYREDLQTGDAFITSSNQQLKINKDFSPSYFSAKEKVHITVGDDYVITGFREAKL